MPRPIDLFPVVLSTLLLATVASGCRRSLSGGPSEPPTRVQRRTVRDVALHTVEVGSGRGPVRLVVHGGPGLDHTYLRPWLDGLAQGARLVYVDLRGHGRSGGPAVATGYTIAAAAEDLAGLIDALGGSADVIAHDFGSTVATELAARHPERVRRLVLVDPLRDAGQIRAMPALSRRALGDAGWEAVRALSTPQGTLRNPRDVTELFRRLGPMWWAHPPAAGVIERMGRDMIYRPEADAHFLSDAIGWDGLSRAREVRAPTLVVSGALDRTFPAADSAALADLLPHGHYEEVREAGHCPFIEQNARFTAVVLRFLADGRPAE